MKTSLAVSILAGFLLTTSVCQAGRLFAIELSAGEDLRRTVGRIDGVERWVGLGNKLIVELGEGRTEPRRALPLAYPAGFELALVLSKHAKDLPAPLDGVVLAKHSGLSLAALSSASKRDVSDPHVEVRPVPWNRVLSETLGGRAAKGPPDAAIQSMLAGVTPEKIRADIQKLVDFQTRSSVSAGYRDAVSWAEQQFAGMGLSTRRQAFSMAGRTVENLIAELPGQAGVEDVHVVGAHLDSTNMSGGQLAPGADDNGSGSACTLAIARVLAQHKPRATIRFILFGGEEQGLVGSKAYVRSLSATERARIKAALIMDMTAFRKGPAGVTLEGLEVSRPLSDIAADVTARYTALKIERSFEAWGSDHVPFLEAGIQTLLTIELDYPNNGNEHGLRDTMAIIDADQAAAIARADLAILAVLNGLGTAAR